MDALPQKTLNMALLRQMGAFIAWGLSWRIVGNGIDSGWLAAGTTTAGALSLVTLLGFVCIYATVCFLRECDDFQRKVHLNAMSLSAGVGFFAAVTLMLAKATGLPALTGIGLGALAILMFSTYLMSAFAGYWRAK